LLREAQVRSAKNNLGALWDATLAGSIVKSDNEARGEDVGGKATSFSSYHAVDIHIVCHWGSNSHCCRDMACQNEVKRKDNRRTM